MTVCREAQAFKGSASIDGRTQKRCLKVQKILIHYSCLCKSYLGTNMASYLSRLDISPRSLLDVTPLMQPPAGVQSNFVNPVSNADIARIPTFVLLPLMLAFVGIRIIGRFVLAHASGADDCTFLPTIPSSTKILRLALLNLTRHVYRCNYSCDSLV